MKNNISGIDRISDLPDALLSHILSFLSPREAVQSCVLSKRWRRTWASVSVLKFYFPIKSLSDEVDITIFTRVKQVLQNRERSLSLDTFKLRWNLIWRSFLYFRPSEMECVLLALKFKPRILSAHVYMHVCSDFDRIRQIFTCASLESISLMLPLNNETGASLLQLREVKLPRLKKLKIQFVRVDDDLVKMIFLGCPVLENLKLYNCDLHAPLLYSKVLKSLVLKFCLIRKNLVISCPSILYLGIPFTSFDGGNISLWDMSSLVDARIECSCVYDDAGLNWSAQAKVMRREVPTWENFINLKSVQIGGVNARNLFNLLAVFLTNSPNLRKLVLQPVYYSKWRYMSKKLSDDEWIDVPPLREHLEVVEIINYYHVSEEIVDQLVKKLSGLVKTIGKIIYSY